MDSYHLRKSCNLAGDLEPTINIDAKQYILYGTESKLKITISDNGPDLPGMDWARLRQHRGGKSWARTQAPGETRTDCDKIERTDALTAAPRSSDDGLIIHYLLIAIVIIIPIITIIVTITTIIIITITIVPGTHYTYAAGVSFPILILW